VVSSSLESKTFVMGLDVVMDFANRIHERYFPDYEKWESYRSDGKSRITLAV
jgi:hypothetical protein